MNLQEKEKAIHVVVGITQLCEVYISCNPVVERIMLVIFMSKFGATLWPSTELEESAAKHNMIQPSSEGCKVAHEGAA
jgi:hypothetical protein